MNTKEIRIGIQKSGNLAEDSYRTLRNAGLVFAGPEDSLINPCQNIPRVQVCFERIRYIPEYVEDGTYDLGIVSGNQLEEEPREVTILASLDFGQCAICVMGLPGVDFSPEMLEGKRIITSSPKIVRERLCALGLEKFEILTKDGNTENAIALGKADFIADIVSTGKTARRCNLEPYQENGEIYESVAKLIGNSLSLEEDCTGVLSILIESIKKATKLNKRNRLEQWILRQFRQRQLKKDLAKAKIEPIIEKAESKENSDPIGQLYDTIQDRKTRMPQGSYTASLFRSGKNRIAKKLGEEAVEAIVAAQYETKQRVIEEIADFWYTSLVFISSLEITPQDIYEELEKRRGK